MSEESKTTATTATGRRILAIADDPAHLNFLAGTLVRDGYVVEKAQGGAEGLQCVAAEEFDCILVDLAMPGMDGIEVCQRIHKTLRAGHEPEPIIILTEHEGGEDMMRALEAGADDFVGRSSDLTVLKARLRALLRRHVAAQEHRRVLEELKAKDFEAMRARADVEAATAKAALSDRLAQANLELETANRRLKETQMHLIQTEKMASLGQLVAGIAHEINNPLAFVLNHLFTIQNTLDKFAAGMGDQLSEPGKRQIEKLRSRQNEMKEGLERIKELVLSLRTFSRLDVEGVQNIDIHSSIDSVLLFLNHRMRGRIKVEKHYGKVGLVSCYPGQFNQVMMNLVANAIEAIEGPGQITISTRLEDKCVAISVTDTGPGVPEAILSRIYDPFFTTKPVGQGTGLGLAICYQIIQAHGGAIKVRNIAGGGAEFTVTIPQVLKAGSNEKKDTCTG